MDKARDHFRDTLGVVPPSVDVLARHAPGALDGYLALREYAHHEPPNGALDAPTRELLFIVLDVAEGHVEAAKAHAEAGIKAGLTVGAITQALVITMMVSGIHTWSQHGHQVVAHAERVAVDAAAGPWLVLPHTVQWWKTGPNEATAEPPMNLPESPEAHDFGYLTAIAGLAGAALLVIVMFATSGQVWAVEAAGISAAPPATT